MTTDKKTFYAGRTRVVSWFLLSIILLFLTWLYYSREWYIATVICVIWALLAISWAVSLVRKPVIEILSDEVKVMERMILGYPIYFSLSRNAIVGIGEAAKDRVEVISEPRVSHIVGLKLLNASDRSIFIEEMNKIITSSANS